MECDKETRQLTERRRSPIKRHSSADSQLTDLVGHFLQFVLRTTHDDHIQSSPGQLEMKQPSNHVCNWRHSNTHSDVPPVHTLFLYPQTLPSPLEWEVEWKHGNQTSSGMETWELAYPPAHGPYFLRLIREMPHGARKKAQNPPNNCHSWHHSSLRMYSEPSTAAMFLEKARLKSLNLRCPTPKFQSGDIRLWYEKSWPKSCTFVMFIASPSLKETPVLLVYKAQSRFVYN